MSMLIEDGATEEEIRKYNSRYEGSDYKSRQAKLKMVKELANKEHKVKPLVKDKKPVNRLSKLHYFHLMTFLSKLELKEGRLLSSWQKVAVLASKELGMEFNLGHVREACESLGIKPQIVYTHKKDTIIDAQKELQKCLNNNAARLSKIEQFLEHSWGTDFTSFIVE